MTEVYAPSDSSPLSENDLTATAPERVRGRPFAKGNPGGPGRPRGTRNDTTRLLDQLAGEHADEIVDQVIKRACEGDLRAAELVLSRIWSRQPVPSQFRLPPMRTFFDMTAAYGAVNQAFANGELTPVEAKTALATIREHGEAMFRFEGAALYETQPLQTPKQE